MRRLVAGRSSKCATATYVCLSLCLWHHHTCEVLHDSALAVMGESLQCSISAGTQVCDSLPQTMVHVGRPAGCQQLLRAEIELLVLLEKLQSADLIDVEGVLTIWQEPGHPAAQALGNSILGGQAGVDVEGAGHPQGHTIQLLVHQHPGLQLRHHGHHLRSSFPHLHSGHKQVHRGLTTAGKNMTQHQGMKSIRNLPNLPAGQAGYIAAGVVFVASINLTYTSHQCLDSHVMAGRMCGS